MTLTYLTQISSRALSYSVAGEALTATLDGVSDTFDFSGLEEGHAEGFESELDIRVVLHAERDASGELHLTLLKIVGEAEFLEQGGTNGKG